METDERTVRQIAARTGLGWKFVSKDAFLTDMLKQLEQILPDECVLKGGAAISRAGYLKNPRFSEDIDLDIYLKSNFKDMVEKYKSLFNSIHGFEIRRPRIMRWCVRYDAYFVNHFGEKDRIKLELAPVRSCNPDDDIAHKTILQSPFTSGQASLLRTYSKLHLLARKIDALSERKEGKDVFDIWGLISGMEMDIVLKTLDAYSKSLGRKRDVLLSRATINLKEMSIDKKYIINSTNHYIPRADRFGWGTIIADVGDFLLTLSGKTN